MEIIEYHHSNFDRVKELLKESQTAYSKGQAVKLVFNVTKQRFEYYNNSNDAVSPEDTYGFIDEAIRDYKAKSRDETMTEDTNVDQEILNNSEETLNIITKISQQTSQANREKMLAVISEIFKLDVVSESDILKTMLEHQEYRKFLSILLSDLGVEIAFTKTSFDLKVETARIRFSSQALYTLEDYKKGILQAQTNVSQIKNIQDGLSEKDSLLKQKTNVITTQEKRIEDLQSQIDALIEQTKVNRQIKPVVPPYYIIAYTEKDKQRFVKVERDAKRTDEGSYPTKFLEKTSLVSQAARFTSAEAHLQVAKMVKFHKNVAFVDIKEKSPRELVEFFTVLRVLIEKPETATE